MRAYFKNYFIIFFTPIFFSMAILKCPIFFRTLVSFILCIKKICVQSHAYAWWIFVFKYLDPARFTHTYLYQFTWIPLISPICFVWFFCFAHKFPAIM